MSTSRRITWRSSSPRLSTRLVIARSRVEERLRTGRGGVALSASILAQERRPSPSPFLVVREGAANLEHQQCKALGVRSE